jgi:hypothetical protein
MAVTVLRSAGSIFKLLDVGATPRDGFGTTFNPLFVILRSVGVSSTPTSSSLDGFLYNFATSTYSSAGSNELSTANGYTVGGKYLQNVRLAYSSGELSLRADDVSWLASGAGITASSALLCCRTSFDSTDPVLPRYAVSVPLALIDFDGAKTAPAGTTLTVAWPSALLFKWSML